MALLPRYASTQGRVAAARGRYDGFVKTIAGSTRCWRGLGGPGIRCVAEWIDICSRAPRDPEHRSSRARSGFRVAALLGRMLDFDVLSFPRVGEALGRIRARSRPSGSKARPFFGRSTSAAALVLRKQGGRAVEPLRRLHPWHLRWLALARTPRRRARRAARSMADARAGQERRLAHESV